MFFWLASFHLKVFSYFLNCWLHDLISWGGGRNVEFQNVDRPKISERWNGLFSFSQLRNQNVENGFLVYHYYENQNVEKNIENQKLDVLILPMDLKPIRTSKIEISITYGVWVLWTPGVKKWIFKNSLAWLNLT